MLSTQSGGGTPYLSAITVFPIKSLDGLNLQEAQLLAGGALAHDREFALFDPMGKYVNGKRNAKVHLLRSSFNKNLCGVEIKISGEAQGFSFSLQEPRAELEDWLSRFFEFSLQVRQDAHKGFPDDTNAPGPTLVSTATLREVASWFPGLDLEDMRRRFRANLEIDGVPAFWEDQLVSGDGSPVLFKIGKVLWEGCTPCQRCVVPTRDPVTGRTYPNFQKIFIQKRQQTLPPWAPPSRFNHYYRLTVNMRAPASEVGKFMAVGDEIDVLPSKRL